MRKILLRCIVVVNNLIVSFSDTILLIAVGLTGWTHARVGCDRYSSRLTRSSVNRLLIVGGLWVVSVHAAVELLHLFNWGSGWRGVVNSGGSWRAIVGDWGELARSTISLGRRNSTLSSSLNRLLRGLALLTLSLLMIQKLGRLRSLLSSKAFPFPLSGGLLLGLLLLLAGFPFLTDLLEFYT
jgi:hypothetical protein